MADEINSVESLKHEMGETKNIATALFLEDLYEKAAANGGDCKTFFDQWNKTDRSPVQLLDTFVVNQMARKDNPNLPEVQFSPAADGKSVNFAFPACKKVEH